MGRIQIVSIHDLKKFENTILLIMEPQKVKQINMKETKLNFFDRLIRIIGPMLTRVLSNSS